MGPITAGSNQKRLTMFHVLPKIRGNFGTAFGPFAAVAIQMTCAKNANSKIRSS
jgi:hypothetical protein